MQDDTATDDDYTEGAATFGDRLALAREAQGLSQDALAERLGLRPQTIRNWEDDRAEPRANKLQMLAGFLGVPLIWLMTGQGEAPSLPPRGEGTAPDLGQLIDEVRALRQAQSRLVERLAKLETRLRRAAAHG